MEKNDFLHNGKAKQEAKRSGEKDEIPRALKRVFLCILL
jgi:hypothetical protein